jgi:hypothetical protein
MCVIVIVCGLLAHAIRASTPLADIVKYTCIFMTVFYPAISLYDEAAFTQDNVLFDVAFCRHVL